MPVETRYKRSDQQTINGLAAYVLGTSQSAALASVQNVGASVTLAATLRPTSDVLAGFPVVYPATPTTHYDKVDEATADDASTYVKTGNSTTTVYDRYGKPTFTLPVGKKIAFVRVVTRALTESFSSTRGAYFRHGVYIGTTYYLTGSLKTGDVWGTYAYDFVKNPATGLAWTEADINGMQIAVLGASYYDAAEGVYYYAYITQVYVEVYTYTDDTAYYGVDVVVREVGGTEITVGAKVAQWSGLISSLYNSAGLKSSTWACPQTALVDTDAVVVRVYQKVGAGAWNLVRAFITEQLGASSLDAATWTVYYYLDVSADTSYVYTVFWHGTSIYDSRIENFTYTAAPTITETITAKNFPMLYVSKPIKTQELISKVEGATITKVANDFPEELIKSGKAKELRSKWT